MAAKSEFIIPFVGLSLGEHEYDFKMNESFFDDNHILASINKLTLDVHLKLNKQSTMLILSFKLKGIIDTLCDRCATELQLPIENQQQLIVKLGGNLSEESDEIVYLPSSEHELDVSQYIYEYVLLAIPQRCIHLDDEKGKSTCDKKALKKLKELSVNEEKKTDPRWDALKKITLNN